MASFTFNFKPLQRTQLHLSSFSHCKYSASLNSIQFYLSYDSAVVSLSPTNTLIFQANARFAAHSETTLSGDITAESSRNNVNSGHHPDFRSGFSSVTDINERAGKESVERNHFDRRRAILKDRHAKTRLDSKRRKEVGEEVPSMRFKSRNEERNAKKTSNLKEFNGDVKKRSMKCGEIGKKVEKKEKRIKKPKADPPGGVLRIGLDMCSKRGDVVGAIKLYDLARKEGVMIGQYHYAVLLYLCSSAATGVVQPAKSGSSTRSLSSGDTLQENSGVGSDSLSELGEMAKRSFCRCRISEQNLKGEPEIEHTELHVNVIADAVTSSGLSDRGGDLSNSFNGSMDICPQTLDGLVEYMKKTAEYSNGRNEGRKGYAIQVSEDMKRVALQKGFEIYNEMRLEKIPMNEATFTSVARMAMALGDGDMAFDIVKQMKEYGINPRLRSYGPALAIFCSNGDVEKAFNVEQHMLENGVYAEEPELEALLKVSIEAGTSDKVYYVLHKLRTSVRQVSPNMADLIEKWFRSKVASRVGKRKWDQEFIIRAMENGGGGWHGKGWLGKGKWTICRTTVGSDGVCKYCGEKLVTIDLDPVETESFAQSVASIAAQREKNSSFQKFQKWLDYYGPFEAVVDAANIGLYSQRKFKPSKVNAVVNGIRQMLPSRKWPLIILHNRRITGEKMDEPFNRSLIEKWRNADALYATPTGSNDDWYWLYAAIRCKCLIVTNDEMRDHLFQLLGNDFFPKWKERNQVHFSFTETGPTFSMPPPCSVVIQESEKGHWHVPIASELESEDERIWLCCSRGNSSSTKQDSSDVQEVHHSHRKKRETRNEVEPVLARQGKRDRSQEFQESSSNSKTVLKHHASILPQLDAAEENGDCVIEFQI